MKSIEEVVKEAFERRASDVHFVCGLPIRIRVDGKLEDFNDEVLDEEDCLNYAREVSNEIDYSVVLQADLAKHIAGLRCRLNIYHQQDHLSIALRILRDAIPNLSELGLPPVISTFAKFNRGIVIITGETGSGKSTTLAALLNEINHSRYEHIITMEDPIEYIHKPDKCVINQREVGKDVATYEDGLKAVLREDPDIILVGEMRTIETIEAALTAAETGHLVFSTLHTNSAADTIDRIVNVFPAQRQAQIRMQLSMTLKAVVSQQLLRKASGKGRVCATEIMIVNSAIKNLIREGKTPQINNSIATSASEGNISMDNCLIRLAKEGQITTETAVEAAAETDYVKAALGYQENKKTLDRSFFG